MTFLRLTKPLVFQLCKPLMASIPGTLNKYEIFEILFVRLCPFCSVLVDWCSNRASTESDSNQPPHQFTDGILPTDSRFDSYSPGR